MKFENRYDKYIINYYIYLSLVCTNIILNYAFKSSLFNKICRHKLS